MQAQAPSCLPHVSCTSFFCVAFCLNVPSCTAHSTVLSPSPLLCSQYGFLLSMVPHSMLPPILLFTRVLAAKLDVGVTDVGHSLTALLVTGVHAVSVPITAPPQGDAQTIQPALELIIVTATRRPCGCRGTGGSRGSRSVIPISAFPNPLLLCPAQGYE